MVKIKPLIALLLLFILSGCSVFSGSPAMSISVSSDGRYVISAHQNNALYLWDIEKQKKNRIARNANLYSAFFIPDSNAFMWQSLDREVILQTVEDEELRRFSLDHHIYGHIMNLEQDVYVSADAEYALRVITQGEETLLKVPGGSFQGLGKVFNLSLSADTSLLVTAGFGSPHDATGWPMEQQKPLGYPDFSGVVLWSLETLEPIAKLPGNSAKAHASISPDGQWVVSGDENGIGRFWNTDSPEERFTNSSYYHGLSRGLDEEGNFRPRDKSGLIPYPQGVSESTVATGFVSGSRFYFHVSHAGHPDRDPFAVLFEAGNPWPIKYFDLGTRPWPSTREYHRNLTVATAPKAGILVTGQDSRGGINVYQFDAENLTLERIWVGR